MKIPDKEFLIEGIKSILDQNCTIGVSWDMGAGSRRLYINYEKETQFFYYEYEGINIFESIKKLIIDKLNFPSLEDECSRGFGNIKIDDKNNLILTYNAKGYYDDENCISGRQEYVEKISIPNTSTSEFNDSIHRIQTDLQASIDEEQMNFDGDFFDDRFYFDYRTLEGDEPPYIYNEENILYCKNVCRSVLEKYKPELAKIKEQNKKGIFYMQGRILENNQIAYSLRRDMYDLIYNRIDYTEILI